MADSDNTPTELPASSAWVRPGAPAWYHPSRDRRRFPCVVASEPRLIGDEWVVRIEGLGAAYRACVGRAASSLAAASLRALAPRSDAHHRLLSLMRACDDAMAEIEAMGGTYGVTQEQLRSAIAAVCECTALNCHPWPARCTGGGVDGYD